MTGERDRLRELLRTLAPSAAKYWSRTYRIDQYPELVEYLTDEDLRANQERPSESDARLVADRDRFREALEEVVRLTALCGITDGSIYGSEVELIEECARKALESGAHADAPAILTAAAKAAPTQPSKETR